MADDQSNTRGTANRGIESAGVPAPTTILVAPSPPQPQYVSRVVGHRRAAPAPAASNASDETSISDIERGLSVRLPRFTIVPTVAQKDRRRAQRPGWNEQRAAKNVTDALANAPKIAPLLPPLLEAVKARGVDVPPSLLIGWVSQESSGRPYYIQPGKLDEIGLFQISRDERVDYLGSTEPGGKNDVRAKMLDKRQDRGAQAQLAYGAQLMAVYQRALTMAGMPADAPTMPQMIRFGHNLGIPQAVKLVHAIAAAKHADRLELSAASWDEVVKWAASHGKRPGFLAAMRSSDYAIMGGDQVLDTLHSPSL